MCVVLETPIEGESTTEVVLGICQVFNICVRVCWWTPHVRDAVQEQVCGWHLNEGGGVPSKRGEGRKLAAPYLLLQGCSRETLQVRGRRWRWSTEHLCRDVTAENWWIRTWTCRHETHCWRESNCRMISYYFLWSVLTYIWFIYNTTLFISSLNLKKPSLVVLT